MSEPRRGVLKLRVHPNAPRSEVAGWHGDVLRVRVAALLVGGRANAAVIDTLAAYLGIHRRDIKIVRGQGSRDKVAQVMGMDSVQLLQRLGVPPNANFTPNP